MVLVVWHWSGKAGRSLEHSRLAKLSALTGWAVQEMPNKGHKYRDWDSRSGFRWQHSFQYSHYVDIYTIVIEVYNIYETWHFSDKVSLAEFWVLILVSHQKIKPTHIRWGESRVSQRSFLKQTCIVKEPARLRSGLPASMNSSERTCDLIREVHTISRKQLIEETMVPAVFGINDEWTGQSALVTAELGSFTNSVHGQKVASVQAGISVSKWPQW